MKKTKKFFLKLGVYIIFNIINYLITSDIAFAVDNESLIDEAVAGETVAAAATATLREELVELRNQLPEMITEFKALYPQYLNNDSVPDAHIGNQAYYEILDNFTDLKEYKKAFEENPQAFQPV